MVVKRQQLLIYEQLSTAAFAQQAPAGATRFFIGLHLPGPHGTAVAAAVPEQVVVTFDPVFGLLSKAFLTRLHAFIPKVCARC